jgi:hypothetical protein
VLSLSQNRAFAQGVPVPGSHVVSDSIHKSEPIDTEDYRHQRDLIDVFLLILHKDIYKRLDSTSKKNKRVYFSGAPSILLSEVTGIGVVLGGQAAFYTNDKRSTNLSSFQTSVSFTANQQLTLPILSSVWTKNNKYNFVGDWRFLKFPEDTYGLGGNTTLAEGYKINYDYIRFYQFVLRQFLKDFFVGGGYQLDYHYNIEQLGVSNIVTDYDTYGFTNKSVSAGVALDVLYDTRQNSINPEGGSFYGNAILRQNLTQLGSDQHWSSLILDVRKYFSFPGGSQNVLAIWSYDWLVLHGNAPYLDLPSTGWDSYNNTGRGYIQSRFRSKDMLDLEAEYRFGILHNGLLGGVVFTNAESFPEINTGHYETVWPAVGAGLRVKFNKFSKTNVAFDYAFGLKGNSGIFVNLGEVF